MCTILTVVIIFAQSNKCPFFALLVEYYIFVTAGLQLFRYSLLMHLMHWVKQELELQCSWLCLFFFRKKRYFFAIVCLLRSLSVQNNTYGMRYLQLVLPVHCTCNSICRIQRRHQVNSGTMPTPCTQWPCSHRYFILPLSCLLPPITMQLNSNFNSIYFYFRSQLISQSSYIT